MTSKKKGKQKNKPFVSKKKLRRKYQELDNRVKALEAQSLAKFQHIETLQSKIQQLAFSLDRLQERFPLGWELRFRNHLKDQQND